MMHLNKTTTTTTTTTALISAAIIIIITTTLASFVIILNIAIPAAATTTTTSNITTTSSLSGAELSPQPLYQKRSPEPSITPINQTHATLTFSGNGMLTLPNTTQSINTTSTGTGLISFTTSSGYARETIRTVDGNETATATFYEILQFNSTSPSESKGIVTAVFQTNSTGMLAPLNGMIAVGIDDVTLTGESHVTLWRWESGISNNTNSTGVMAPPPVQDELPTNTTTAMTNATTSDTNTTRATGEEQRISNNTNSTGVMAPPPVQDELPTNTTTAMTNATTSDTNTTRATGEEQQQQQQERTLTIPPPLFDF